MDLDAVRQRRSGVYQSLPILRTLELLEAVDSIAVIASVFEMVQIPQNKPQWPFTNERLQIS